MSPGFISNFVLAYTTENNALGQSAIQDYGYLAVMTIFCMTSDCHLDVFNHGPAPEDDVACIAIHCDVHVPVTFLSIVNPDVVGTFVNS